MHLVLGWVSESLLCERETSKEHTGGDPEYFLYRKLVIDSHVPTHASLDPDTVALLYIPTRVGHMMADQL